MPLRIELYWLSKAISSVASTTDKPVPSQNALVSAAEIDAQLVPATSLRARLWNGLLSFLSSAVLHLLVILVLAWMLPRLLPKPQAFTLQATLSNEQPAILESVELTTEPVDTSRWDMPAAIADAGPVAALDIESPWARERREATATVPRAFGIETPPGDVLLSGVPASVQGMLEGRQPINRGRLVTAEGGTPESEAAVERGLAWLAKHQRRDGSWHFDHNLSDCQGQCRNAGDHTSTTAATAVALLPFLGAGQTHRHGEHQRVIQSGLNYLRSRIRTTPHGADLREGTMYAQGLAAITLCEAYALTQDPALKEAAQAAIDYIVWAQDKQGGGWRYAPGEVGDTTVTGWQVMALKSAQMAYLRVPPQVFPKVTQFLNTVQSEGGARYGYLTPGKEPNTTAVGLLCRMYLGWTPDNSTLRLGVEFLADTRPSPTDLYFNYYATQVLHHFGGRRWETWNTTMRDHLVKTQMQAGHESGSWHFANRHTDPGGRLLCTALAIMTLEVYYRYLPLYRSTVLDGVP